MKFLLLLLLTFFYSCASKDKAVPMEHGPDYREIVDEYPQGKIKWVVLLHKTIGKEHIKSKFIEKNELVLEEKYHPVLSAPKHSIRCKFNRDEKLQENELGYSTHGYVKCSVGEVKITSEIIGCFILKDRKEYSSAEYATSWFQFKYKGVKMAIGYTCYAEKK